MCVYSSGVPSKEYKKMIRAAEVQNKTERQRQLDARQAILSVSDFPNDFEDWIDSIFDKIMYYQKIKRGKYEAQCEACQVVVKLTHARSGRKIKCPHCGAEVLLKDKSRSKYSYEQRKCVALVERSSFRWTQRLFCVWRSTCYNTNQVYSKNYIREEQRDYIDHKGDVWNYHPVPYWEEAYKVQWKPGVGKSHGSMWVGWRTQNQELYTYPHNLCDIFRGSEFQYSAIDIATKQNHVNPFWYLLAYQRNPKLELLYKVGLYQAAREIYEDDYESKRLWREVKSLKDLGLDNKDEAKEYGHLGVRFLFARKEVKSWKIEDGVQGTAWTFVKTLNARCGTDFNYDFISRERWFKYYLTQTDYCKEVGNFIRDYTDYIAECVKLGLNLKDTAVNRPKSLKVSHEWARTELKIQETQV